MHNFVERHLLDIYLLDKHAGYFAIRRDRTPARNFADGTRNFRALRTHARFCSQQPDQCKEKTFLTSAGLTTAFSDHPGTVFYDRARGVPRICPGGGGGLWAPQGSPPPKPKNSSDLDHQFFGGAPFYKQKK